MPRAVPNTHHAETPQHLARHEGLIPHYAPIASRAEALLTLERNEVVPAFTYAYSPTYPGYGNLGSPVAQPLESNEDTAAYAYPPPDAPWATGPYFIPGIRRSFEASNEAARINADLDRQRVNLVLRSNPTDGF